MALTKIPAAMTDADLATQAELDVVSGVASAAASAAAAKQTGDVVQVVNTQTGAVSTGTTTMPNDDTIPQNTEGNEYMTATITPASASNVLLITVVLHLASSVAQNMSAALFQDSTANALAAAHQFVGASGSAFNVTFTHRMVAGTTSATTFKVRAGGNNAGTTTFNGVSGTRVLGGVLASSITITEIKV